MKLRVLLVDDHEMFREGLKKQLESKLDLQIVAEAANGEEAVAQAKLHKPDLIILDINMPKMNGIEAAEAIRGCSPHSKIIALTMHTDKGFVTKMIRSGASAYVSKQSAFNELELAISAVSSNRRFVSPSIEEMIVHDYLQQSDGTPIPSAILSDKEKKILQNIAEGKNTKEIALQMNLSPKTVETHRMHIMEKLHIHTIAELTKYALREGLTSLES